MRHVSDERKVALVTGGAKRVGRAIVERFARDGWDVAFTFRHSQKQALQLQNDLASSGVRVLPLNADFDRLDQTIAMLRERFIKWSPRLTLLVNNASAYAPDVKLSADAAMRANFVAPVRLIETFAGELASASGSVVNMLDILAERPMPSFSNYSASKAALWNATLSLARSLAPAIRVNGIAPGVVEWNEQTPEADRDAYVKRLPLKRIGTADEVATLVKFLAVDATFITGQVIRIDGGRSLL
jgi:pteridine reductase